MSQYEDLIKDLGSILDIPLHADAKDTCRIEFEEGNIAIQIDLDDSGERLLIGSILGELPAGSYRNQVFELALRVNYLANSPRGTLAYSDISSSLILFEFLPIATTVAQKLHDFVLLFVTHAKAWIDAIKAQSVPRLESDTQAQSSGMFGMSS